MMVMLALPAGGAAPVKKWFQVPSGFVGEVRPRYDCSTDVNGVYFFDDLLEGNYQVRIPTPPASAPTSSTPLTTAKMAMKTATSPAAPEPATTISPLINLAVDQEVVGEALIPGGELDDANGDMTIDFDFSPPSTSP